MTRTARRSPRCRRTGAASIRASGRIGIELEAKKMAPRGGAIFLCRPSVTVRVTVLDDHDLVGVAMAPAIVPAAVVVHLGTRAVPAVMMATALDDDGLGAGDRWHGDGDRTERREHISKLLHGVLLTL